MGSGHLSCVIRKGGSGAGVSRIVGGSVLMGVLLVLLVSTPAWARLDLRTFKSHHYEIHTNLQREQVVPFGRHMDRMFEQFEKRFSGFRSQRAGAMPIYLLRTHEDYLRFMAARGINAANSGGMFFVLPESQGLATWTEARSRSQTFEVLQHEGFHQFAHAYLGAQLPVWANEGLAQYFEDAILVRSRLEIGLANDRRLALVKHAVRTGTALPLETLLNIDYDQWSATLRGDAERARLLYAQSWNVVYFLVHGDGGKYQRAFTRYLHLISDGRDSAAAFRQAFGTQNLGPVEKRWRSFVETQEPDPVNAAASKLEFLGTALAWMQDQGEPMPRTLDDLKKHLQARQFRVTRQSHGLSTEFTSLDDSMYQFTRRNGSVGMFELLAPTRDDLPPRITARGLAPEPTLVWSRNAEGSLVQDVEYR